LTPKRELKNETVVGLANRFAVVFMNLGDDVFRGLTTHVSAQTSFLAKLKLWPCTSNVFPSTTRVSSDATDSRTKIPSHRTTDDWSINAQVGRPGCALHKRQGVSLDLGSSANTPEE